MNIGEALLELKSMRSELARLQEARENSFRWVEEKPKEKFAESSEEIVGLIEKIRKFKLNIEETNHFSYIDTPEGKMSLAEAIHYVGDLRSELSCLEKLREKYKKEREYGWGSEKLPKFEYQIERKELLAKIRELEKKKVRMDAFLSSWNWKVKLKE